MVVKEKVLVDQEEPKTERNENALKKHWEKIRFNLLSICLKFLTTTVQALKEKCGLLRELRHLFILGSHLLVILLLGIVISLWPSQSAGERNVIRGLLSDINKIITANLPAKYLGLLEETAPSIDSLIPKIIMAESSGDPNAVNKKTGAKGLMQIMDETAKEPGFGVKPLEDPFDPVENVRFGTDYFSAMMNKYDNDVVSALAAYNMGPTKTDKWIKAGSKFDNLPKETQDYINKILK